MFRPVCLLIGYAFGLFQSSYLIGKVFFETDIRALGSHNAGSTNAVRSFGAKAGLAAFALDIAKAAAAFMVCTCVYKSGSVLTPDGSTGALGVLPGLYGGFGAVIGHDFPFYLNFKGGKGMAASLGAVLFTHAYLPWLGYASAVAIIAASKRVSLGSVIYSLLVPVLLFAGGAGAEAAALSLAMGLLCVFLHRENIKRLAAGTERRFSFRKAEKND